MSLFVTELASEKISQALIARKRGLGIRISIKTTGCSGMSYVMEFVDTPEKEDLVFDAKGVKLFSDPKSMLYIDGTVIDWTKEGLNEGFKFTNPNAKGECGCGESFNV